MMDRNRSSESGQVLVLMAASLMFVLIGVAAMAVDLGYGHVQKRRLQNTADAAALAGASEIARGASVAQAATAAQNVVSAAGNTGDIVTLPVCPCPTSDDGLLEGIEISGASVRVALVNRNVPAFFSRIFGNNSLTVAARAKANVDVEGILPIAVKRYSKGQTYWQIGDSRQPEDPSGPSVLSDVVDFLGAESSSLSVIDEWPTTLAAPAGGWPMSGSLSAGPWPNLLTHQPAVPASDLAKGPVIPILGEEAQSNPPTGAASDPFFHFMVAPDLRNVSRTPEYYNGAPVGVADNAYKLFTSQYFDPQYLGYSSSPLPEVGDEIAILNGVADGLSVGKVKQWYPKGTSITAMVYDGTVHKNPNFDLFVSPALGWSTYATGAWSGVAYSVLIDVDNASPLMSSSGVRLRVLGLDPSKYQWRFSGCGWNSDCVVTVMSDDVPTTVEVKPLDTFPSTDSALQTFTVEALDYWSNARRVAFAGIKVGSIDSFYANNINTSETFDKEERGATAEFQFQVYGTYTTNTTVSVADIEWSQTLPTESGSWGGSPAGISLAASSDTTASVRDGHDDSISLRFTTTALTTPEGEWLVRVRLVDGTSGHEEYVYLVLKVWQETSGYANNADYVYVLGYASFEICYYGDSTSPTSHDNNTIFARAVSGLASQPSELHRGRKARLVGWFQ